MLLACETEVCFQRPRKLHQLQRLPWETIEEMGFLKPRVDRRAAGRPNEPAFLSSTTEFTPSDNFRATAVGCLAAARDTTLPFWSPKQAKEPELHYGLWMEPGSQYSGTWTEPESCSSAHSLDTKGSYSLRKRSHCSTPMAYGLILIFHSSSSHCHTHNKDHGVNDNHVSAYLFLASPVSSKNNWKGRVWKFTNLHRKRLHNVSIVWWGDGNQMVSWGWIHQWPLGNATGSCSTACATGGHQTGQTL